MTRIHLSRAIGKFHYVKFWATRGSSQPNKPATSKQTSGTYFFSHSYIFWFLFMLHLLFILMLKQLCSGHFYNKALLFPQRILTVVHVQ